MSSPFLLGSIVLAVTLAGILHLLVIRAGVLALLTTPLDFGMTWRSKRLFGAHKTWRGLIVMTVASAICFFMIRSLVTKELIPIILLHGALLGLGYILGELPNSFMKRQMGITEGRARRGVAALFQYLIDQADSVIGVTVVAALLFGLSWQSIFFLLIVGTLVHVIIDVLAHEFGWKHRSSPMKRYILSQIFVFCCCKILFKVLNKTSVYGLQHLESIKPDVPLIIAANHRNRYDSYIIAGAMPWKYFRRLLPKRYMTAAKYMDEPGLGHFLYFCGAYSTAIEEDEKTHYRSKSILRRGETIMMYPEGCMTERLEGAQKAKVGVMWIARGVENTHILPVKIESNLCVPIPAMFRGGQTFKVTFGAIQRPELFGEDLQPQVNELMDTIYSIA